VPVHFETCLVCLIEGRRRTREVGRLTRRVIRSGSTNYVRFKVKENSLVHRTVAERPGFTQKTGSLPDLMFVE
jgi:hypothetical protein